MDTHSRDVPEPSDAYLRHNENTLPAVEQKIKTAPVAMKRD